MTRFFSWIAALLSFSEILADSGAHGKYMLSVYDPGRRLIDIWSSLRHCGVCMNFLWPPRPGCYMRLDAAAQRALNVMKARTDANDNFSLYGLMSRSRTAMGKRLLKARQDDVFGS